MYPSHKITPDQVVGFRQDQLRDLRMELVQLKTCQNQIVLIALAGAGVMLGLANSQSDHPGLAPFFFLLPLVILIPFWIIFFEKARTISRIIGFIMVQEKLLLQKSSLGVIGWESAMGHYRREKVHFEDEYLEKIKTEEMEKKARSAAGKEPIPERELRDSVYWFTVYSVLFLLSLSCIVLSVKSFLVFCEDTYTTQLVSAPHVVSPDIAFWFERIISSQHTFLGIFPLTRVDIGFIFLGICIGFCLLIAYRTESTWKFEQFRFFCVVLGASLVVLTIVLTLIFTSPWGTSLIPQTLSFGYWIVFVIFTIAFLVCACSTLWFFKNLVRGRYSYHEFELRWKWILCITFDEKSGRPRFDTRRMILTTVFEHDQEYDQDTLFDQLPRRVDRHEFNEIFNDLMASHKIELFKREENGVVKEFVGKKRNLKSYFAL